MQRFCQYNVISKCNDYIQVKKNIIILRHPEVFKETNTQFITIQNINTFIQQIKEIWLNKSCNMIINDFLSLYKIKQNIKLLSLHSNTLPTIQLSNEIAIDFCKQISQIGKMCQGVYIKKNSRTINMNMCINCENLHWNKVKRVKRKWSNYG